MSEAKYTQGPWTAGKDAVFANGICTVIATTWGIGGSADRDENAANTRLIAAAPDLLEALREIADFPYVGTQASQKVETIARAAIAKATGRVD